MFNYISIMDCVEDPKINPVFVWMKAHSTEDIQDYDIVQVCGNKKCVNEKHLLAVDEETLRVLNELISMQSKRCRNGHLISDEIDSTVKRIRGDIIYRQCLACYRESSSKYRRKIRAARRVKNPRNNIDITKVYSDKSYEEALEILHDPNKLCRKGKHYLIKSNTKVSFEKRSQRWVRRCKTCDKAYRKSYNYNRRVSLY